MKKLQHFKDHQGNYITKSGYKIDDYLIDSVVEKHKVKDEIKRVLGLHGLSKRKSILAGIGEITSSMSRC